MKARLTLAMLTLPLVLAACEDRGNEGNDNLLTGGSLIVVLIVVAIVAGIFLLGRRSRG